MVNLTRRITNKIEIVNRKRGEEIMTKHNYNEIFNINENFMIIKYETE